MSIYIIRGATRTLRRPIAYLASTDPQVMKFSDELNVSNQDNSQIIMYVVAYDNQNIAGKATSLFSPTISNQSNLIGTTDRGDGENM